MTWDFFTWLAIGVLILGSSAVFVWFVRDVRQIFSEMNSAGGHEAESEGIDKT